MGGQSMWATVLDSILSKLIVEGELDVTYPDGRTRRYGPGGDPFAAVQIHDTATMQALCRYPEIGFGEAYMDGTLTTDGSSLMDVMKLAVRNSYAGKMPGWTRVLERLRYGFRKIVMRNTARRSRANVAHHYDISDALYRLFLDKDMQYSCAYFTHPDIALEDAQIAKKNHIARKLCIEPGMRVLDIGCGWGGMALTLSRDYGAHVTGVTLSQNQLATAQGRAAKAGLSAQTEFRLQDYRALDQKFDRIVSVGMLEHVGAPHFQEYFDKVGDLLAPDGISLIHTIGRNGPPTTQSPWLNKYIFPGGYVPSLEELVIPVGKAGLWNLDIESWRLHYAMTLRHWLQRFDRQLPRVREMYDERFIRMWRFYLIACIMVFEEADQCVFQLQLGHKRDAAPLTRDYLYDQPDVFQQKAAE